MTSYCDNKIVELILLCSCSGLLDMFACTFFGFELCSYSIVNLISSGYPFSSVSDCMNIPLLAWITLINNHFHHASLQPGLFLMEVGNLLGKPHKMPGANLQYTSTGFIKARHWAN